MIDYTEETAKYEKYLADQDAYLTALEAVEVTERVEVAKTVRVRVSQYICKMCFVDIGYDDHGTCRRCRAKLGRQAALKTAQLALIRFGMKTTGSKEVDNAIRRNVGGFHY